MKRARITVKGDVQNVGFRSFLIEQMNALELKGHVENLSDGTVEVLCEGDKEKIEELVNIIKETPIQFARVDLAEPQWYEYVGDLNEPERRGKDVPKKGATLDDLLYVLKSFDSKAEILNTRIGGMSADMKSMSSDMKSMSADMKSMSSDMKSMSADMKCMSSDMKCMSSDMKNIDNTLKEFRKESGEKQDQMLDKQDQMLDKQDETINSIDQGFARMDKDFSHLDTKYDVISHGMNNGLNKIFEELVAERKENRKTMEKLINAVLRSKSNKKDKQTK